MKLATLGIAAAVLFVPAAARADTRPSEPSCGLRIEGGRGPLPRNTPALLASLTEDRATAATFGELLLPSGARVQTRGHALDRHGLTTIPLPSLEVGKHELTTTLDCTSGQHYDVDTSFVTGPDAPLPTAIGTLERTRVSDFDSDVVFTVRPSAELSAFLSTSVLRVTIEGAEASLPTPIADLARGEGPGAGYELTARVVRVCIRGRDDYLTGKHPARIKVEAFIAGVDQELPALTYDDTVDCDTAVHPSWRDDGCAMGGHARERSSSALGFALTTIAAALYRRRVRQVANAPTRSVTNAPATSA